MPHTLRALRADDRPRIADVCLRTADLGGDATGLLSDDALWADVFALPYTVRHPEFAFVIADADDAVVGYCVAAPDTDAFEEWFRTDWWPVRRREPDAPGLSHREAELRRYADGRRAGAEPFADTYPAHLHIDLLPAAQGAGWGRRLIDAQRAALADAGVPGLHLVAAADNAVALGFYDRLGFTRLPSQPGTQAFGVVLS